MSAADPDADLASYQRLVWAALAPSSHSTYESRQRAYLFWCGQQGASPLSPSADAVGRFLGWLHRRELSFSVIRGHLSAVRSLHVDAGLPDPTHDPRLRRALHGAQRTRPAAARPRKLPLTPDLLLLLRPLLDLSVHDNLMVWAALVLGVLGHARIGEITATSGSQMGRAPLWRHVSFNLTAHPRSVALYLPSSKTDQLGHGANILVGAADVCGAATAPTGDLCAATIMWSLLHACGRWWAARGHASIPPDAPVFHWLSGEPLTRSALTHSLRAHVAQLGLDPAAFSGISLRKGGATAAHAAGLPDATIRAIGRWRSDAHLRYQHVRCEEVARAASAMVAAACGAAGAPLGAAWLHGAAAQSPQPGSSSSAPSPPPPRPSAAYSSSASPRLLPPLVPPLTGAGLCAPLRSPRLPAA